MPHLVVDITGHGFGHAGQTAPVIEALRRRRPDLRVTIRSRVPEAQLEQLLAPGFARARPPPDLGLTMHSPISVDRAASRAWYERLHSNWAETLHDEAGELEALAPDLLLANVGFVGLAAAARCGVPAVAMSSLNWADIVQAYDAAPAAMLAAMRNAYLSATVFVQLTPHMPMEWLDRRVSVGPVGRKGKSQRRRIAEMLKLDPAKRWVVVSFGGIPMGDLVTRFPAVPDVEWLVDIAPLDGMHSIHDLDVPFIDLIASADIVLTKTGYGLFVEPAAHGLYVIYIPRPDWPESPFLEGWLEKVRAGAALPDTADGLARLISLNAERLKPPALEQGIDAAAEVVEGLLYPAAAAAMNDRPMLKRSRGG